MRHYVIVINFIDCNINKTTQNLCNFLLMADATHEGKGLLMCLPISYVIVLPEDRFGTQLNLL